MASFARNFAGSWPRAAGKASGLGDAGFDQTFFRWLFALKNVVRLRKFRPRRLLRDVEFSAMIRRCQPPLHEADMERSPPTKPYGRNPHGHAQRARLRGMPEDRRSVGSPTAVPDLRPCRLLRQLAEPPRDQAFPRHPPSDHRGYDPPEGWGWCYVDELISIFPTGRRRRTAPSRATIESGRGIDITACDLRSRSCCRPPSPSPRMTGISGASACCATIWRTLRR